MAISNQWEDDVEKAQKVKDLILSVRTYEIHLLWTYVIILCN